MDESRVRKIRRLWAPNSVSHYDIRIGHSFSALSAHIHDSVPAEFTGAVGAVCVEYFARGVSEVFCRCFGHWLFECEVPLLPRGLDSPPGQCDGGIWGSRVGHRTGTVYHSGSGRGANSDSERRLNFDEFFANKIRVFHWEIREWISSDPIQFHRRIAAACGTVLCISCGFSGRQLRGNESLRIGGRDGSGL